MDGVLRSPSALVLTASEVATVVARLEGEACTARRVRYLLSGLLMTETASQRGQTRLYGPVDVALMRLAVRLEAQGVSAWVVRVVLSYGGEEIRAAWRAGATVALAVRGVTGTIEPARLQTPTAVARVLLRSVTTGNAAAIRRERRTRPMVWMWRPLPASALGPPEVAS
jgi:hypothetical protein